MKTVKCNIYSVFGNVVVENTRRMTAEVWCFVSRQLPHNDSPVMDIILDQLYTQLSFREGSNGQ